MTKEQPLRTPERIITEVEMKFELKPGTIASKKITMYISRARREAIVGMREQKLSYSEIGRLLRRNHSSIPRLLNYVPRRGDNAGKTQGTTSGKGAKSWGKKVGKSRGQSRG